METLMQIVCGWLITFQILALTLPLRVGLGIAQAAQPQPAPRPTGAIAVPEIVVEEGADTGETGYGVRRSSTATRTDTPIVDTPASIQVVPRQVIEDQRPFELRDTYRNVSGVQPEFTGGNVNTTEAPIIRGFSVFNIFYNGFRLQGQAPVELANIDRIEVLKGPASVLYGQIEPGGVLNLVTKLPRPDAFRDVEQQFGSFDFYRTTLDATGPVTASKNLLYRLNVAYTNDDTFRDFADVERIFIAPSLAWRLGDRAEIVFDASYSYEEYPFDHGLAFSPEGRPVASISTFLGEPGFRSHRNEYFASYRFTYRPTDQWTVRNAFLFHRFENQLNAFRHFGRTNPDLTVNRTYDNSKPIGTEFQMITDAIVRFDLAPTRHELLGGVDLHWEPRNENTQNGPRAGGPEFDFFRIAIVNPQYGAVPFPTNRFTASFGAVKWIGVYAQDQIAMLDDRLRLLLGGRFEYVEQEVFFNDFKAAQADTAFTGRGGVLYKLTSWLHPYVSVSQSFAPTSPFTTSVGDLDPERGLQYEGGVKLSFFDERLLATLAVYHIDKENVPVEDPDNPGFSINGGELRSRGFEFDLSGEILPGLSLLANYAYTDTKVLKSDVLPIGGRFRNVPLHSASLWARYGFQRASALSGLTVGAGVFGVSDRVGDDADTFTLDGFGRVDAFARYRLPLTTGQVLKAQLNILNLFDKEYFESSSGTASVFPGQPFTVIGALGIEF